MPVYMTARFMVNPDAIDSVNAAIREFIDRIRENESKTILYSSMRETEQPNSYLHYFVFQDSDGEAFHRTTDWVKRFTNVLYPETINGVEFKKYSLVASTDEA